MTGSLLFVCTDAVLHRLTAAEGAEQQIVTTLNDADAAAGSCVRESVCGDGGCERVGIAYIFVLVQNLIKIK